MSQRIYFHRRMHIHVHCHELSTIEPRALHSFPVVATRFPLEEMFRLTGGGREVTGLRAQGQGWNGPEETGLGDVGSGVQLRSTQYTT
jgi:hypothetical protein